MTTAGLTPDQNSNKLINIESKHLMFREHEKANYSENSSKKQDIYVQDQTPFGISPALQRLLNEQDEIEDVDQIKKQGKLLHQLEMNILHLKDSAYKLALKHELMDEVTLIE